jgi:hypothetical protein
MAPTKKKSSYAVHLENLEDNAIADADRAENAISSLKARLKDLAESVLENPRQLTLAQLIEGEIHLGHLCPHLNDSTLVEFSSLREDYLYNCWRLSHAQNTIRMCKEQEPPRRASETLSQQISYAIAG